MLIHRLSQVGDATCVGTVALTSWVTPHVLGQWLVNLLRAPWFHGVGLIQLPSTGTLKLGGGELSRRRPSVRARYDVAMSVKAFRTTCIVDTRTLIQSDTVK